MTLRRLIREAMPAVRVPKKGFYTPPPIHAAVISRIAMDTLPGNKELSEHMRLVRRHLVGHNYTHNWKGNLAGPTAYNWVDPRARLWLKIDAPTGYFTQVPINAILGKLNDRQAEQFADPDYHPDRSQRLGEALDAGEHHLALTPIRLNYNIRTGCIDIGDGIHRLKEVAQRRKRTINAKVSLEE